MAPATNEPNTVSADEMGHGRSGDRHIGAIIGGCYRLTRRIGSGSSSHVFEAEHLRLGKSFALKLLRSELDPNRRTAQRFRREARAIARLKSEHIVSVIDCGELDDGTPYLVMELLEGEDLRSLLNREGSLPARRAVSLIIEACRGLSEVHAAGLVHRDLKPENLFMTKRSTGEDWCKVLDFGVAKMAASLSTAEDAVVGTLRYMAPEQLEASNSVGPITDVYALGAILYECLSGQPAHHGDTAQEVMYSVMNRETPDGPLRAACVPAPVVEVVMSCLAKKQTLRPCDTAKLVAMLSRLVGAVPSLALRTLSEDHQVIRATRPHANAALSRQLAWAAGIAAAALLIGWFRGCAMTPSDASGKIPEHADGAQAKRGSAASMAPRGTITAATAAMDPARPVFSQGPREVRVPTREPSGPVRGRPAQKLTVSRGSPAPSGQVSPVAVGRFDPANPYAE